MSVRTRRVKWHPAPPPPPTPKIINLPRRYRRRKPRNPVKNQPVSSGKGKLGSLFGEEREFERAPAVVLDSADWRERVVEEEDGGGSAEEKWRFQAEILRAECNFLRMERRFALKKLERNRLQTENTLKSALQNLASGRKKICEGKNMEMVLEEEIQELAEKLEELQSSSYNGSCKDGECKNFDKKAARLQRRLEKFGGLSDQKFSSQIQSSDVEILRRKMEGVSKGMVARMEEEYGSILSNGSSASTSKRIDFPDHSSFSIRRSIQPKEASMVEEEGKKKCSGRCKEMVRRMVEQVRAETEQWNQMQEMLGKLRREMEELQTSRDFWEAQALASANEIQTLHSSVQEWREKAMDFEAKSNKLQTEISLLKGELENSKKDQPAMISLGKQLEKEKHVLVGQMTMKGNESKEVDRERKTVKESQPLSLGKQLAREKRILICRMKENNNQISRDNVGRRKGNSTRSPFRDIGNSSSRSLMMQNSNAVFPLHCPDPVNMAET